MKLVSFVIILLGIGIAIPQSPSTSTEKCIFDIRLLEVKNYESKIKLNECFKSKRVSVTARECTYKCSLIKHGFFDRKKGYFNNRAVKDYLKKYTNATDKYVEAVVKMYGACVTSSRELLESLKRHGETLRECRFYGLFEGCVMTKLKDEIHNNMDRFCQNQTRQNQTNRSLPNQNFLNQTNRSLPKQNLFNQTNSNLPNQTNLSFLNQTNLSFLNQTNLSFLNQTNPSFLNQTNPSFLNQTNLSFLNQTNLSFLNQNQSNPILSSQTFPNQTFSTQNPNQSKRPQPKIIQPKPNQSKPPFPANTSSTKTSVAKTKIIEIKPTKTRANGFDKQTMSPLWKHSSINYIILYLKFIPHFVILNLAS